MDGVTNGGFDNGGNKSRTTKSVIAHHQISYNKTRFLNQNREEIVLIGLFCYILKERERELNEKIEAKGGKRRAKCPIRL
jgi:hypothetical protein